MGQLRPLPDRTELKQRDRLENGTLQRGLRPRDRRLRLHQPPVGSARARVRAHGRSKVVVEIGKPDALLRRRLCGHLADEAEHGALALRDHPGKTRKNVESRRGERRRAGEDRRQRLIVRELGEEPRLPRTRRQTRVAGLARAVELFGDHLVVVGIPALESQRLEAALDLLPIRLCRIRQPPRVAVDASVHQGGERRRGLFLPHRPLRHLLDLEQALHPPVAGQRLEMHAELVPHDGDAADISLLRLRRDRPQRLRDARPGPDPGLTRQFRAQIRAGAVKHDGLALGGRDRFGELFVDLGDSAAQRPGLAGIAGQKLKTNKRRHRLAGAVGGDHAGGAARAASRHRLDDPHRLAGRPEGLDCAVPVQVVRDADGSEGAHAAFRSADQSRS